MIEKFYLFIFDDDDAYEMTCAVSLKDAVWEMAKYMGGGSDLFFKSLKGFNDEDVEGVIELYNHFSYKGIRDVYEVKTKIWGGEQK